VLKLAVCAPVIDSGVICLHRSVTGIPEVGVVGNAGRTGSIDIRLDWAELASKNLTADRRKAIRKHLGMCHSALKDLLDRLDGLLKGQNNP
jgi:hypothetical protein